MTCPLTKLDIAVANVVTMVNIPAASSGRPRLSRMVGQAVPSMLSGNPSEIKAM